MNPIGMLRRLKLSNPGVFGVGEGEAERGSACGGRRRDGEGGGWEERGRGSRRKGFSARAWRKIYTREER